MRIIGLDYGSKTVGVAVSDPLGITAQGLETIWRERENKLRRTCARIEELVRYGVEFDKNADGDYYLYGGRVVSHAAVSYSETACPGSRKRGIERLEHVHFRRRRMRC